MQEVLVNGFRMAYQDIGAGAPVLLVHGLPLTGEMWQPQIEELSRHFRLIVPDLRGLGQSAAGVSPVGITTMEAFADDLVDLLDGLGLEKVAYVGLSMGGYIAFAFYRKYAARLNALLLCDTRSGPDTPEGRVGRYQMIEKVKQVGAKAAVEVMVPRLFAPATYQNNPALVAHLTEMIERQTPAGIIAAASGVAIRPDSTPLLSGISVPTLVIAGEHDVITPSAEATEMAAKIPGARLVIIPQVGHMSNMEDAGLFNQIVINFLNELKVL